MRLEVFRAVFDRGPRIGDPACIWQGSGGSVSVEGDTRMVLAWYAPARESAESAAGALRGPVAMRATGAAGQLWAGRWCPVAARTAGKPDRRGE